ncbi:hypothetical protein NADFUDRAFT_51937 [Nadsonia fulvescens var. elongata DSM 6958]|uniref:Cell wall protein PhiA n=1 Tax=Nadsonia fulvescens var. elongata DSM 6958 TaxID=857566 RepID=A0A1E3PK69_9ASCO|nr:hypothetical protein NADFUDRAFT_51937 [Nadsonia fulvescens var. elongata DSM 6958]
MKFSTLLSAATAASSYIGFASAAPVTNFKRADSEYFSVITTHSASPVHLRGVVVKDNGLYLSSSGTPFVGRIDAKGGLAVGGTNSFVSTGDQGALVVGDAVTTFWARDGNSLKLNGEAYGLACPQDNGDYKLYWAKDTQPCSNGLGVSFYSSDTKAPAESEKPTETQGACSIVWVHSSEDESENSAATPEATSKSETTKPADTEKFGLISIRSGSDLQYLTVNIYRGTFYLGPSGGSDFEATIQDGELVYINGANQPIYGYVYEENSQIAFSENKDQSKAVWSVEDGNLALDGKQNAIACPAAQAGIYQVYWASNGFTCEGGLGVALKVQPSA